MRRGYTQEDLASKVGIINQRIYEYEQGRAAVSLEMLYQIPLLIEQIRNITNSFNSSAGNTDNKITQNICK